MKKSKSPKNDSKIDAIEATEAASTNDVNPSESTLDTAASEWGADPIATGFTATELPDANREAESGSEALNEALDEDGSDETPLPEFSRYRADRDENGDLVSAEMTLMEASALLAAEESAQRLATAISGPDSAPVSSADALPLNLAEEVDSWAVKPAPVTFISSPFGFDPIASVREAQASNEELDLDSDLGSDLDSDLDSETDEFDDESPFSLADDAAETAETFGRLEERMAAETAALTEAANAAAKHSEGEAEIRLAEQIAEDEALERAIASENELETDPELRAALPSEPTEDAYGNLDLAELESCIESLLFMCEKPLSTAKLRDLLGPELALEYFDAAISSLQARYAKRFHGFELVEIAHGYQFRTKPARAPLAKKLAKTQMQRLSTGAMESLAIIAYKQPVLKDDVDKIRGVDSSHFIRGLMDKKLIKIAGRSELPGRPMLYETTTEFLELFSLKSLDAMPPLQELESMIPTSATGNPEDADPRVRKMRALVSEMNLDDSVSLLYDPKEDDAFLTGIREKVKSIEIVTPTLKAQNDEAEAVKAAAKVRAKAIADGAIDPQSESFANSIASAAPGETADFPIDSG